MGKKSSSAAKNTTDDGTGVMTFASPDFPESGQGWILAVGGDGQGGAILATFTVDTHCLGVRKISFSQLPLQTLLDEGIPALRVIPVSASVARGIVEGAVAYAKKLGFPTPDNLARGLAIFGDTPAKKPAFAFGRAGRPFYTQQRGDNGEFVENVLAHLKKTCGADGFGYLLDDPSEDWLDEEDGVEEGEEE